MLYLDYAKPLYNGKYILNFFADSIDDLEQISHGESFKTKNGFNYGSPQPGSTVTITMPNSNKTVYSLDASNKWIITNTISVSEINVNPDTEATEQLNKLEINGTVYNVLSDKDINTLRVSEVFSIGWIYDCDGSRKCYVWFDGDGERRECSFNDFSNKWPEYVFLNIYGRFFKPLWITNDELKLKGEHEYVYVSSSGIFDFPSTLFVTIGDDYWGLLNYYGEDVLTPVPLKLLEIPFGYGLDVVVLVDQSTSFSAKATLNLSDDGNTCIYWIWENTYYEIRFTDDGFTHSLHDIGTYANVETTSETAALTSLEVAGTAYKIDSGTKDGIIWKGTSVYNSDTHVLESITISPSVTSITYEEFEQAFFDWAAGEIPYIRVVDGHKGNQRAYNVVSVNDYSFTGTYPRAFVVDGGSPFATAGTTDVSIVPLIWKS